MTGWGRPFRPRHHRRWARQLRTAGRGLLLIVIVLLACAVAGFGGAVGSRSFAGFGAGCSQSGLATWLGLVLAQARREVPLWLQRVVDSLNDAGAESKKES